MSRAEAVAFAELLDALRGTRQIGTSVVSAKTRGSDSAAPASTFASTTVRRARVAGLLLVLWTVTVWVDRTLPTAGLWSLLGLSLSTGFVHGALDAQLLLQRFASRSRALAVAGVYLLAVLALCAVFNAHPSAALLALIAMSAWHFGESYGRWTPTRSLLAILTRVVVGGAPVLLFPWEVSDATAQLLLPWLSVDALQAWRGLGVLWLVLFAMWAGWHGGPAWRANRYAWLELAGVGLLNLSLSPPMAFAIYFGAYHAPAHIWRVWRSGRTICNERNESKQHSEPSQPSQPSQTSQRSQPSEPSEPSQRSQSPAFATRSLAWRWVASVAGLTILLGAILWLSSGAPKSQPAQVQTALRWLIVFLAALTLPHLVLISTCARMLSPLQRPPAPSAGRATELALPPETTSQSTHAPPL